MDIEQYTDMLCVYLYDLISENIAADGHLLSSRDSDKLQICAERLSAQANLIEDQAKQIEQQAKRIAELDAEIKALRPKVVEIPVTDDPEWLNQQVTIIDAGDLNCPTRRV